MNNTYDSDVPFEAMMIEEFLSAVKAQKAWLFLVHVNGEGLLKIKGPMTVHEVPLPASADDLCALLTDAEKGALSFCGASFLDGENIIGGIAPRTIDEPNGSYILQRIQRYTAEILASAGLSFVMTIPTPDQSLPSNNPRERMN